MYIYNPSCSVPHLFKHENRLLEKMYQEQPRREDQEEGIKQGDVGNTQKDAASAAAAAPMQSAATKSEKSAAEAAGLHDVSGRSTVSESVGGQVDEKEKERKISRLVEVVEQFSRNTMSRPPVVQDTSAGGGGGGGITIGEALEATALTAGKKAVEWSDAAAIQAAEVRATGRTNIVPGGVAAAAQSAATLNARATKDEEKAKLADILAGATSKLPADRAATRRDAEGVTGAEMRNDPNLTTHPGGVSASIAAAARLNQNHNN